MSLEQSIEALIVALDRNTAALAGAKPAATPKTEKPKEAKKPGKTEEQLVAEAQARVAATEAQAAAGEAETDGPTKEQAGEALQGLLTSNKKTQAIALLKKFKAQSLSGLAATDYAAFIEEANDILLAA